VAALKKNLPKPPPPKKTAGVVLVEDAAAAAPPGARLLSANVTGLTPGSAHTLLFSASLGGVRAPGVVALTRLLVPDTAPPTFLLATLAAPPETTVGNQ
jgi:hypothetical protein